MSPADEGKSHLYGGTAPAGNVHQPPSGDAGKDPGGMYSANKGDLYANAPDTGPREPVGTHGARTVGQAAFDPVYPMRKTPPVGSVYDQGMMDYEHDGMDHDSEH